MNQDPKPEIESKVEESLKALSGKYAIIGKWSIRSWKTWLIIGVVAGVLGGATYVANKNVARLESEQSAAGTLQPKITVMAPNGGETLSIGYFYSVNWKVENNDKVGNSAFMLGIEEKYKIGPFNRTRIVYTENLSQAISSLRMINNVQIATYSYQWKVPSNIKAGKYSAVVYLSNRQAIKDKSDQEFDVVAPFIVDPIIKNASINGGLGVNGNGVAYSWRDSSGGLPVGIKLGDKLEFAYNDGQVAATAFSIVRQYESENGFYVQIPWLIKLPYYTEKNYYKVNHIPIAATSITVLSPNGGEKFMVGRTYTIKWKSVGDIKGVALYLVDKDGNVSQSNLTNITGNTGNAKWKISVTTPGNYRMQIDGCSAVNCTVDGVLSSATMIARDQSDATFNIR